MKRGRGNADHLVTLKSLNNLDGVIELTNGMPGPRVSWDEERGCFGLKADKSYRKGELVTTYGGRKSCKELFGDYVAKASEIYIDGKVDFLLSQKGRWINESDRERRIVNVDLGRNVRATQEISEGEWIFADYGPDYIRTY